MKDIGNHAFASFQSKSRNEMIPNLFTIVTAPIHTDDCIHSSRKFMEKLAPDTTNYSLGISTRSVKFWGTHFIYYGHKDRSKTITNDRRNYLEK